jgi:transcriptional antiterminator RfaH
MAYPPVASSRQACCESRRSLRRRSKRRHHDSLYAVFTHPHAEAKALEHLLRQGYSAYLPRDRTQVSHARRRQTVLRPLFPRYLFAGIDRASMPWRPILSTFGVVDVAPAGDEPAAVPTNIVAAIQERESAGDFDRLKSAAFASSGRACAGDRGRLRRHDRHSY